ncbi:MAG: molybdopterin dinucleotide binding domain-containing protein [Thermoleophilia bacterium]
MFTEFSRRDFFKKAGVLSAALALSGCGGNRAEERLVPFLRSPEEEVAGVFTDYASVCRQCPAGCGILVKTMGGRAHKIEGNPRHPLNQGKLCARGQAGLQALYNPDRLAGPQVRSGGPGSAFGTTTWDDGVALLADALAKAQAAAERTGSQRVAVVGGQLSDHLYRVAAALLAATGPANPAAAPPPATTASGGGGSAPASSAVRSRPVVWSLHRAMDGVRSLGAAGAGVFGGDAGMARLPLFDLAAAEVAISFSADLFGTWLSPVYYGRAYGEMRRGRGAARGYLVQVDPRLTATGVSADQWLATPAGREADVALVLGRVILDEGLAAAARPAGVDAVFKDVDAGRLAADLGLSFEALVRLARLFAKSNAPLAIPGGGLGARENGGDAVLAVMALNLLVGAQGRTLRPPAGLPAAGLAPVERVSSFSDVRSFIADMAAGTIDVLLVLDGDPLHDLPAALGFREAVARVPLIVDFSPFPTDTGEESAHLRLPAPTYLETWGYQVPDPSIGLQTLGAQQPVVRQLHDTRSPVDVMLAVAKGLGSRAQDLLPWETEVDYLKASVAALVGRTDASLVTGDAEVLWVKWQQYGGWWSTSEVAASDAAAGASAAPPASAPTAPDTLDLSLTPPQDGADGAFLLRPFPSLTLGDGRHANQPWLQETPDPMTSVVWDTWVEVDPGAALELGVSTGDIVKVTSDVGSVEAPVYIYRGIGRGTVAMPLGQGHRAYGRYAAGRGANTADLISPVEGRDGELAWGATWVTLEKVGRSKNLATLEGSESTVIPEGL